MNMLAHGGGPIGPHRPPQGNPSYNPGGAPPPKNSYGVFVGDLASHVNEEDLKTLFATIGPVASCKVIRDPVTQRSKKYGFVHFSSEEHRQRAIEELHNANLKGQTINVRTQHYKETDRCLMKPGTKPTDVYIGNIPKGLVKADLQREVSLWGIPDVKECRIHHNESGSFCFLTFPTEIEAKTALNILNDQLNPRFLAGRSLLIQGSSHNTSQMNARFLQNPSIATSHEEQAILYSLEMLKTLLGGEGCPLTDNQLALLEKSQRTLYVRNLQPGSTEMALRERFQGFGRIKSVVIVTDKETQVPVGYGFVEFFSADNCSKASTIEDHCSVSRPPKEIHAMLTALGLTDSNGRLSQSIISSFQPPQQPPQQAYFQDPKTGQLFLGDAAHAAHYVSQGYVQVQLQQQPQQMAPQQNPYQQYQQGGAPPQQNPYQQYGHQQQPPGGYQPQQQPPGGYGAPHGGAPGGGANHAQRFSPY